MLLLRLWVFFYPSHSQTSNIQRQILLSACMFRWCACERGQIFLLCDSDFQRTSVLQPSSVTINSELLFLISAHWLSPHCVMLQAWTSQADGCCCTGSMFLFFFHCERSQSCGATENLVLSFWWSVQHLFITHKTSRENFVVIVCGRYYEVSYFWAFVGPYFMWALCSHFDGYCILVCVCVCVQECAFATNPCVNRPVVCHMHMWLCVVCSICNRCSYQQ